jgi:hypothetical protein
MTRVLTAPRRAVLAAIVLAAGVAAGSPAAAAPPAGRGPHGNGSPHGPPPGHGGGERTDQGVVQSVSGSTVVIRALDGSTLSVPVGPGTRVLVDGRLAAPDGIAPGDVAVVTWNGRTTQRFEAFDLSPARNERLAVVKSVGPRRVVVSGSNGSPLTIRTNGHTRVYLDGRPATLRSVHAGFTLVLGSAPAYGKPVAELVFLSSA